MYISDNLGLRGPVIQRKKGKRCYLHRSTRLIVGFLGRRLTGAQQTIPFTVSGTETLWDGSFGTVGTSAVTATATVGRPNKCLSGLDHDRPFELGAMSSDNAASSLLWGRME